MYAPGAPLGPAARAVGARLVAPAQEQLLDARHGRERAAPSASVSTGTSRHSSGSSPSARQASSIASRAASSRRKTIAMPGTSLRQRQQHARAVAGLAVGGGRAAVAHVAQPLEQGVDDLARGASGGVGDEADPAGVTLDGWAERRSQCAPRLILWGVRLCGAS